MSDHDDGSDPQDEQPTRYESEVPGHFFVKCPACGTLLHLGRGWRGRETPLCPACDEAEANDWQEDPRVTMNKFLTLAVHEDEE